jgi:hypothetical protein
MIRHLFANAALGSALRTLIRAGTVLVTAFGLELDPAQIAAVQAFLEAVLLVGTAVVAEPDTKG